MKHFLIVVDMQKDFVDGALGTKEAQAVVPGVVRKIKGFEGSIIATLDTHTSAYPDTQEGRKLPVPHCIRGTDGWQLNDEVQKALDGKNCTIVEKPTFGSVKLPEMILEKSGGEGFTIELIGLCTDICVISNALLLKAHFPEAAISVDAGCCAGVSKETHEAALTAMQCCQIDIIRG